MAMIVLSSPATLTGAEEKKTGPSRFIADFLNGAFDGNRSMFTKRQQIILGEHTERLH
jgi:hypothetical protein